MVLGMSLSSFTTFHVILSLMAIAVGFVVVYGMAGSKRMPGWTAFFLLTTVLTSVTGFFFPFAMLLPSHIVGVVSLAVLALAVIALYLYRLSGTWRWIYVAGAIVALYLNVFVLVVQGFLKVAPLNRLAPTQSELPFVLTQGAVLVAFVALFVWVVRAFRPRPALQT